MEGKVGHVNRKRPLLENDFGDEGDFTKPPKQKRARFPKGKKAKPGDEAQNIQSKTDTEFSPELSRPRRAALERAKQRNKLNAEIFSGQINDAGAAEVSYEDNENFADDGIEVEPFNLDKEREEGYFDANGNFVEYVNENEFQDPWLDSLDFDKKYEAKEGKNLLVDDGQDDNAEALTSEEVGKIKRRIADVLLSGETVLQGLRRLKGTSDGKKHKMPPETQTVFDQLTEDANKLLDEGEYNVYEEKQEVFQREAEGYENLARAKDNDPTQEEIDIFADNKPSSSLQNVPKAKASNEPEIDDIFATGEPTKNGDYVYDEASGYYYSSSTGYYYDSSSGYYCHATSGQWYCYNEETGTYEIMQNS